MNSLDLINMSCYYLEIGQDSLKALAKEDGLELPLERRPNGRLTEICLARVTQKLVAFFGSRPWQPPPRRSNSTVT